MQPVKATKKRRVGKKALQEAAERKAIASANTSNAAVHSQLKQYFICELLVPHSHLRISKLNPSHESHQNQQDRDRETAQVAKYAENWKAAGAYSPQGSNSITCFLSHVNEDSDVPVPSQSPSLRSLEDALATHARDHSGVVKFSNLPPTLQRQFSESATGIIVDCANGKHRIKVAEVFEQDVYASIYKQGQLHSDSCLRTLADAPIDLKSDRACLNLVLLTANQVQDQRELPDADLLLGVIDSGATVVSKKHSDYIQHIIRNPAVKDNLKLVSIDLSSYSRSSYYSLQLFSSYLAEKEAVKLAAMEKKIKDPVSDVRSQLSLSRARLTVSLLLPAGCYSRQVDSQREQALCRWRQRNSQSSPATSGRSLL